MAERYKKVIDGLATEIQQDFLNDDAYIKKLISNINGMRNSILKHKDKIKKLQNDLSKQLKINSEQQILDQNEIAEKDEAIQRLNDTISKQIKINSEQETNIESLNYDLLEQSKMNSEQRTAIGKFKTYLSQSSKSNSDIFIMLS